MHTYTLYFSIHVALSLTAAFALYIFILHCTHINAFGDSSFLYRLLLVWCLYPWQFINKVFYMHTHALHSSIHVALLHTAALALYMFILHCTHINAFGDSSFLYRLPLV